MRRYALVTFLILGAGCQSTTDPVDADVLDLRAEAADLVLSNRSPWPLSIVAIERNALAYTDFVFCTDASVCGHPSGSSWKQPLAMVPGYAPGREVVVYWKEIVPSAFAGLAAARTGTESIRP